MPRRKTTLNGPCISATPGAITCDGPMQPLVNMKAMARYLDLSNSTLRRLVKSGKIPHVRFGDSIRFDPLAVRRSFAKMTGKKS